jgi:hypothetical protein
MRYSLSLLSEMQGFEGVGGQIGSKMGSVTLQIAMNLLD